ncbi:DUF3501 family protein [Alicyclobacillus sp. SO9]|uniref:DUF3501 family protein n=1 Tax=Alicyclobacillus sp. SO9 TaxID=2665646 RepID=UPI0018E75CF9|nr:DUF3501 family protein [Alicyclobacillus sp. SO9]
MAHTIVRDDLQSLQEYGNQRQQYIRDMIEKKNQRRVRLAPDVSLLFENKDTVLYQIQELIFGEDLENESEIAEYIDIYSPMLPGDNELSGTLFIEMDNQEKLEEMLARLKGIENHLYMQIGNERIQAVFEEEHDDREFTTSVHYLKFPLTPSAAKAMTSDTGVVVKLVLDHPELQADMKLDPATIASLGKDLQA